MYSNTDNCFSDPGNEDIITEDGRLQHIELLRRVVGVSELKTPDRVVCLQASWGSRWCSNS